MNPEHQITDSEIEKELLKLRGGPALYEPNFNLTERRPDFGVPKIIKPSEKKEEEADFQPPLYPNYDIDKPNHLVFKYNKPTEHFPPNPTHKELYPERWEFYDVDLDAVRETLVTGNPFFAGSGET